MDSDPVLRSGKTIDTAAFRRVLDEFMASDAADAGGSVSDLALAPLLHSFLRLNRSEAADAGMWTWLAVEVARDYVEARWTSKAGSIADNRWHGGINKQALARLWWGAELFRDGDDYTGLPFTNTDMSNSINHVRWVRNRPMAVSVDDVLQERFGAKPPKSSVLRPWFKRINLLGGGRNLEALGVWHRDDQGVYSAWVESQPVFDERGAAVIEGPPQLQVSVAARDRARSLLSEALDQTVKSTA